MKILVACEESQEVTIAFRNLGYEAYSCDLLDCSGNHPEWHIKDDVRKVLNENWNMIIAFPPCTDLAVSGASWFEEKRNLGLQQSSIEFFLLFVNHSCKRIAIENPIGIMSTVYRKPDQIIQPYMFGHPEQKSTCLWLKNLPYLKSTNKLIKPVDGWKNQCFSKDGRYTGFKNYDDNGKILSWNDSNIAKIRSKTYPGIAKAMAEQWSIDYSIQIDIFDFYKYVI